MIPGRRNDTMRTPTSPNPSRNRVPASLLGLLFLVLTAVPAPASTEVIFGTIVTVDSENGRFTIFAEMFNYVGRGEGRVEQRGWGDRTLFMLDGDVSTAAEALKPGRAVMYQNHGSVILVSGKSPGMDAVRKADDPANAVHRMHAHKAVPLPLKARRGGGVEEHPVDVEIVVDVVDGRVAGAVAMPSILNRPNQNIDAGRLVFADGKVTGTVSFAIAHPAVVAEKPIEATLTLTAARADKQSDAGCISAVGGKKTTVGVTTEVLPRAADLVPGKAWMRLGVPGVYFRDHVFAVFDLTDGKAQPGGHHWYHKGKVNGSIDENSVALAGDRLTGELRSTLTAGGGSGGERVPQVFKIDARVLGHRYIFGTLTVTIGDKTHSGFVRGGLVPADSPITGLTKELAALYAERFPKRKKRRE